MKQENIFCRAISDKKKCFICEELGDEGEVNEKSEKKKCDSCQYYKVFSSF